MYNSLHVCLLQKMFQFPLIPQLQAYMGCPALSTLMKLHKQHRKDDCILRGPYDDKAWNFFEELWSFLKMDARHVHLVMSIDGVNPFG